MVKVIGSVEREMILVHLQTLKKKLAQPDLGDEQREKIAQEITRLVKLHGDDVDFSEAEVSRKKRIESESSPDAPVKEISPEAIRRGPFNFYAALGMSPGI